MTNVDPPEWFKNFRLLNDRNIDGIIKVQGHQQQEVDMLASQVSVLKITPAPKPEPQHVDPPEWFKDFELLNVRNIDGIIKVQNHQQQEVDMLTSQVNVLKIKNATKPRTIGEIESERCWKFFCLK